MAFRVPTPNVSVVDLTVRLEKPVRGIFCTRISSLENHELFSLLPFLVDAKKKVSLQFLCSWLSPAPSLSFSHAHAIIQPSFEMNMG